MESDSPIAAYLPAAGVTGLSWSPDGRFIVFLAGYNTLHFWDPSRPDASDRTIELSDGAESLVFALSPDGGKLAADIRQNVRIFSITR